MPAKKKTELNEGVTPEPVDPAVLESLGARDVEFVTVRPVKVGVAGMSDVVSIRQTLDTRTDVQGKLTLTEARQLGTQNWALRPDGCYGVVIQGRRFIISAEIYKELA